MIRTLHRILALSTLAIVSLTGAKAAYAQDVTGPNYEIYASDSDRDHDRERVIYTAGESTDPVTTHKSITEKVSTKDSVAVIPATVRVPVQRNARPQTTETPAKPVNKQPKGEDDSILSFNFLYYIIQKYKLQDIVD